MNKIFRDAPNDRERFAHASKNRFFYVLSLWYFYRVGIPKNKWTSTQFLELIEPLGMFLNCIFFLNLSSQDVSSHLSQSLKSFLIAQVLTHFETPSSSFSCVDSIILVTGLSPLPWFV